MPDDTTTSANRLGTPESLGTLQSSLTQLSSGKASLARMSLRRRIELLEQCVHGVAACAKEWVDAACLAKGIPAGSPCRAEEVLGGPAAAMRQLQLFLKTLHDIERDGAPRIPAPTIDQKSGRLGVRVTPSPGLYDPLVFLGFQATTWLTSEVTRDNLNSHIAPSYRDLTQSGLSLVLGAGNVASIPVTDMLTKLCVENRAVLLKMNAVNEYLAPIFERAFVPLIESGLLRIICGDVGIAASAIADDRVDDVHITGSDKTHAAIVWGSSADERERRLASELPRLTKPISSELGNVTPWIVVPGAYGGQQLQAQVENIVSSMVNNSAFNCVATRVIVTWKQWSERERFMQKIESTLAHVPQRTAYYPGAFERYERYVGSSVGAARKLLRPSDVSGASVSGCQSRGDGSMLFVAGKRGRDDTLPWTLIRNICPKSNSTLMHEESFIPVCIEVALDASSPEEFLSKATDFANDQLWGTLAVSLSVPNDFRRSVTGKKSLDAAIERLQYGLVCLNHWSGIGFALMTIPWGGYPTSTLRDPRSGIGWVHNSLMLTGIEKTVLQGPLTVLPKPVWSPTHNHPEPVAWALFDLFKAPSLWTLNRLGYVGVKESFA